MKRMMALFFWVFFFALYAFPVFAEDVTAKKTAPETAAVSPSVPAASANNNSGKSSAQAPAPASSVSSPDAQPPSSASGAIGAQAAPQIEKKVVAMDVRGNRIVSTNTILSKIQTKQGLALKQQTINEDIKRLYATGFFEDVRLEVEELPDGYKLIVEVDEKPIVKQILI